MVDVSCLLTRCRFQLTSNGFLKIRTAVMKTGRPFLSVSQAFRHIGWGCSSVGRATDRHAADAGSIPRCGKGFFSLSQLSVQILFTITSSPPPHPPGATACIYICSHVKDSVVHVRVRWIMETLKHQACTVARLSQLATRVSYGRNSIGTIQQ